MTLAQRLKIAMDERNLSQGKLAKISGLSQSMIWKLLHEQADGTTKLVQLARALQVSPEWLQSGTGDMESTNATTAVHAEPVEYNGLFTVRIYEGEQPTDMVLMVPDLVRSDSCRAYKLGKDSGCAEAPAGTLVVVDSTEEPGQNDLVYASVGGGIHSVYRYIGGGENGFLAVDDQRVPLVPFGDKVNFSGVVVYLMRDLRN